MDFFDEFDTPYDCPDCPSLDASDPENYDDLPEDLDWDGAYYDPDTYEYVEEFEEDWAL